MVKTKTNKQEEQQANPPVFPDLEDWPIYKLHADRKRFIREIDEFTVRRLADNSVEKVTDMIAKTIYRERIRIKEEPWKVDPPKERQFWRRIRKQLLKYSLDKEPEVAKRNNEEVLRQIVHRYSEEIVGTFKIKTFLFARKFLTFFFNRLLQAKQRGFWRFGGARKRLYKKLRADGEIEKVRSLMKKGTVVVVPTHFSNLDSILIGYALDAIVGLPSFHYGAGLNLYNTGYTAYFMNRLGAYRIDRRKKNPIYLETLKTMSREAIKRGTNSIFFPGGTRSRSGSLETKLKLGMLSTAVEAQRALLQEDKDQKIFIVPLVLGYHFVLEAPFLVEQHLRRIGRERYIKSRDDFFSLTKIIRYTWKVLAEGNEISVSIGQPMDVLGNIVDEEGNSYDQFGSRIEVGDYFRWNNQVTENLQRESEYTQQLGEKIVERYHKDNVVLSSHLVAFAAFKLLCRENSRLDLYGVLRLPPEEYVFSLDSLEHTVGQMRNVLMRMAEQEEIKLSDEIYWEVDALIADGMAKLGTFHVKKPLKYNKKKQVVSESFHLLYYYHNRLENYQLDKKIEWQHFEIELD